MLRIFLTLSTMAVFFSGLIETSQGCKNVMKTASEGEIRETTYWWPRPGSIKPLKKHTFYTKVGDQICGVGYWEGPATTHSQQAAKSNSR